MKTFLKSYMSFTRTERIGLVCLCGLLLVFIVIRATMHLWVHPVTDKEREQKLVAAWETFKQTQVTEDIGDSNKKEHQDASDENTTPLADTINLNTADSATLVRLKGIGPVTAGKIVNRRKSKGPFTSIDQIMEVGVFNIETLDILKKHLIIKE